MRMLLFEIAGYKKLLTGIGKEKISIDFSKSTHNICLIVGPNGSGKSSLLEAMHPLPDSNDNFIEGRIAYKKIIYDNGYSIYIEHGVNDKGVRQQSKAYIKKSTIDGVIELNPNGNITSYKELLESELEIDGAFVALSKLSSEDKGLADKRPAERKKLLNSVVPNMDVYNAINKTIVKRSTIFKSMINSLTTKIDNIGNPEQLQSTLVSMNNRLNRLEQTKNETVAAISENDAKIKLIDPDSSIQKLYEEVSRELEQTKRDIDSIGIINYQNKVKSILSCALDIETLSKQYKFFNDSITKKKSDIDMMNERIKDLLLSREEEIKIVKTKTEKMNMLTADLDISSLEQQIDQYTNIIEEGYKITNIIGIDPDKVSKDEFLSGMSVLEDIQSIVDNLKSGVDYDILYNSINACRENIDLVSIYNTNLSNLDTSTKELEVLKDQYREMVLLESRVKILEDRPKNCKDDSCYFIKDAVDASKLYSKDKLDNLSKDIKNKEYDIDMYKHDIEICKLMIDCYNSIQVIIRSIRNYNTILRKLPYGNIYGNEDKILDRIENYDISEIKIMQEWKNNANLLETIKIAKDTLYKLQTDYKIYQSKNSTIDELIKEIDDINLKVDSIQKDIDDRKILLDKTQNEIIQYENIIYILEETIEATKKYNELTSKRLDCENKIKTVQSNIDLISAAINNVNSLNVSLNNIYEDIRMITEDRDKIKYSLSVLESYKAELKEYQEKYEVIETIKYYSSPSTGIQTLFIKLYMANTLNLANRLLSNLFEGELVLEPYVIDEDNFRIPVINGGMYIDDVSSCSTAQKSLIAMIISFTMLKQSSSIFNILRLDEIDGGLDTNNRIQIIYTMRDLMNILDVSQLFMISHNNELPLDDVDVILLKNNGQNYNNIIWRNE